MSFNPISLPARRYAYSEDDKEEDDEHVALTAAGASSSGAAAGAHSHAQGEKKAVNTDVFSLDDEEEGKLE